MVCEGSRTNTAEDSFAKCSVIFRDESLPTSSSVTSQSRDLPRQLQNRALTFFKIHSRMRRLSRDFDRVVAHTLAPCLHRACDGLRRLQNEHCRRFFRQMLRNFSRRITTNLFIGDQPNSRSAAPTPESRSHLFQNPLPNATPFP